ncbi:MAG: hypothetical protein J6Y42_02700 [Bacilli bacterium]|nr:hypothetical protein [Bacilli bacterium]
MAHKEDVEILLELYHKLIDLNKSHDKIVNDILRLMDKNNESITNINFLNKMNSQLLDDHSKLILRLFDEITLLKVRINELETQVKTDKGSC